MTVIRPNSVSGINSITVQSGNSLAIHKSNGELLRTITGTTGVTTFSSISVGSAYTDNSAAKSINIGVGASIAQHDANTLSFGTGGDERARLDANGFLGIGTATVVAPLQVYNATNNTIARLDSGDATCRLQLVDSGGMGFVAVSGDNLIFANTSSITERARIDSNGRLLLGTTTEGHSAADELTISNTTSAADMGITLRSATNGQGAIYFSDGTSGDAEYRGIINYNHTSDFLSFYTAATQRLRIDSSGRLLIGTTSSRSVAGGESRVQIENTSTEGLSIVRTSNDNGTALLALGKTRNGAIVQDDDVIGTVGFYGDDGNDIDRPVAEIRGVSDGTPGANDMPGRLEFKTTTDGSSTTTERLRITSAGEFGIAGANYGTSGQVLTSGGSGSAVSWTTVSGTTINNNADDRLITGSGTANTLNGESDFKITSGQLHINTNTSSGSGIRMQGKSSNGGAEIDFYSNDNSTLNGYIEFSDAGSRFWNLTNTETTFRTNNTERLKIEADGDIVPGANGTQDFGSSSLRWANVYTSDLDLSNESKGGNDVDGTWGSYTIQEGESDLFLINKRNGKKYKFNLTEVS